MNIMSKNPSNKQLSTREKILEYISSQGQASPKELTEYLEITPRAVFKQLSSLLENQEIKKIGTPPKVYYLIQDKIKEPAKSAYLAIPQSTKKIIEENFMLITPLGEQLEGIEAFISLCNTRNYDVNKKAIEYAKIFKKYETIRQKGLINGLQKINKTFTEIFVNEVFYLDFYSIEIFGKTKLGLKLLYAKQSQNMRLIKELSDEIKPKIISLIKEKGIDGVLFVPPTVKREIQFMKELEKSLNLSTTPVKISKIKTPIQIPQKTLNKLEDRVENAKKTFVIEDNRILKNVLIIDDAVGSGATINEISGMLKNRKLVTGKIIGLAITGSLKGFDVISEV